MRAATAFAPAKINLTLDITGRRADGYHLLASVFQTIDLGDTVTVRQTDGAMKLSMSDRSLPADERNTAWKAARLFLDELGVSDGADITVEKRIPVQAGLAGGSADAAGVLAALNALYGMPMSVERLCRLGERVGADVPFCLIGGTALVTGIGECIQPQPPLPDCAVVVAKPAVGVSTAEAYRLVDSVPITRRPDNAAMCRALREKDIRAVGGAICNVFEEALALPEVRLLRERMAAYRPLGCAMSGSGSAVFALFTDEDAARSCVQALKTETAAVFCCRPYLRGAHIL